jgi:hypothetical protein
MLYQGVGPVFPTAIANLGAQRFAPRSVVRRVCRPPAVPTTKALIDVLPVALHRQTQHDQDNHALAGRAVSGIAVYKHGGTRPRVDRVWHPADFPKGYHARPCPSWSGTVCTGWRVKDSNLGRHQPTDLQSFLAPGRAAVSGLVRGVTPPR